MELLYTAFFNIVKLILAIAIIEGICYIPLNKELKKRDQQIRELEKRIDELERNST